MNLAATLQLLAERWRSLVAATIVALAAATLVWALVPPEYQRTATLALVPATDPTSISSSNPFLMLDSMRSATDVAARVIGSEETLSNILVDYPDSTVDASRDPSSLGPLVLITVTAPTDVTAEELLDEVVQRSAATVHELQVEEGILESNQVSVLTVGQDTESSQANRTRALLSAAVSLAVLSSVVVTMLLRHYLSVISPDDSRPRRRRARSKEHSPKHLAPPNVGDDPPMSRTAGPIGGTAAASALTVYIVLLYGIPSNLTLTPLGTLGRPAMLWGLLLSAWWILARIPGNVQQPRRGVRQPVRLAFGAFCLVSLGSYAMAILGALPNDQISPATGSLLRLVSWGGVLVVAMDGIQSLENLRTMTRRLAVAGGLVALFGLTQFVTGQTLLDWLIDVPGVTIEIAGAGERGAFIRAPGTAMHALEFTAAIAALLPLAIAWGATTNLPSDLESSYVIPAMRARGTSIRRALRWAPAFFIVTTLLVSISRSALIGLTIALVASLPALPKAYRIIAAAGSMLAAMIVVAVVPGLFGTTLSLFTSSDASTQSRSGALSKVPEFLAPNPYLGTGLGTFLPRYYIFDNQWILILVELGVLGLLAFAALVITAVYSGIYAGRAASTTELRRYGMSIAAGVTTISVMLLFFDGLSFSQTAGTLFLLVGLTGAARAIAMTGDGAPGTSELQLTTR